MIASAVALTLAVAATWVPMRWLSGDPASLELLAGSPVNCLLVEREHWSPQFVRAARERRFAVLGVLHSGEGAGEAARLGLDALVLEGDFQARAEGIPVIRLASRRRLATLAGEPVAGTWQGVWPGLRVEESPVAGPTAAPWLDTNSGFVKFAHEIGGGIVWMGNRPPPGSIYPVTRYLQAVADAALGGGRWIVALDADMNRRLLARDARLMSEWRRICELLRFFEDHADWRRMRPYGRLAVAQSFEDGGFVSGGVLDMIAVQHVPVRPARAKPSEGVQIIVDGQVVATAPEGWRFPETKAGEFAMRREDLPKLDPIWKAVKDVVSGQNLGVRVFNASSLLSNPLVTGDGKKLALPLVNYTGYPAEAITVHVTGKWSKARLLMPNQPAMELQLYPVRDGVGLEIERIGVVAAVELEAGETGQSLTPGERQRAVAELQASRKVFLDAIRGLPPAQWSFKPEPGRWSVAECAEHIALTEDFYFDLVTNQLAKSEAAPEKRGEVQGKDDLVLKTMADRGSKRVTGESLEPKGHWKTREDLLAHFNQSRDRLIAYVESTPDGLRSRFRAHRAVGLIDGYQWILLASGHVRRHTAQIDEVKAHAGFPKK